MKKNICKLNIDNQPFSFNVQGDFFWGEEKQMFIKENNIISKTNWMNDGYFIFESAISDEEYKDFYNSTSSAIEKIIKKINPRIDLANYSLNKYHEFITSDEDHQRVINLSRNLSNADLSCDIEKLADKLSHHIGYKLSTFIKELKKSHVQIRISRPNSLDINPPHKDSYLSYYENILNIWLPISGCNEKTSLPVVPKSHLISEKDIYRTGNQGAIINKNKYMVPCILKTRQGELNMIRPNPRYGDALIFSPSLIHGAAFNLSNETRVSLELRFTR